MSTFFDNILPKYKYDFCKGFGTERCLLALPKKRKRAADNGEAFHNLLTDLSKAIDCLNHELLIAKLNNAHGFSLLALKLVYDYLSNIKQRTKINLSYSE